MKKQSTKLTKAVFGLMMALGSQALAKNQVVTAETLIKNNVDVLSIQELINAEILLKTAFRNRFELNDQKITVIIETSENEELKQYVLWLKSIVGSDSQVCPKDSGDMTVSSQDGGGMM